MVDGTEMGTPASRKAAEGVKGRMETFTGKEDDFDVLKKQTQELTDKYTKKIDDLAKDKQKEIMEV